MRGSARARSNMLIVPHNCECVAALYVRILSHEQNTQKPLCGWVGKTDEYIHTYIVYTPHAEPTDTRVRVAIRAYDMRISRA